MWCCLSYVMEYDTAVARFPEPLRCKQAKPREDETADWINEGIGLIRAKMKFLKLLASMKNGVFWDVTPCGSCKKRRYEGT
jgi:hypothetical protein